MMRRAIQNLLGIGRASTIDDSGDLQKIQVTEGAAGSGFADRVTDNVPRVTEFVFSSVPPEDAEVLVIRRGGDRAAPLIIATSHRPSRPKGLKPGDAAIYDVRGAIFKFTEEGPVLDCAGLELVIQNASKITFDCPEVEFTGRVKVAQTITGLSAGEAVEIGALRDAYNAHKHTGVTTGTGISGQTDTTV